MENKKTEREQLVLTFDPNVWGEIVDYFTLTGYNPKQGNREAFAKIQVKALIINQLKALKGQKEAELLQLEHDKIYRQQQSSMQSELETL